MKFQKKFFLGAAFITFFTYIFFFMKQHDPLEIRYIPIGDSYTIGEGARSEEAWPNLLVKDLRADGVPSTLVANPARTGWTSEDALLREMSIFGAAKPTFATLLIGVNDFVQGVSVDQFRANFEQLIDQMIEVLPSKQRLLIATIPDFSVTPAGKGFGDPKKLSAGVAEFNTIIKTVAMGRGLEVVDIFALSQAMGTDSSLVAVDGLHPSAREYALWEQLIKPAARNLLLGR